MKTLILIQTQTVGRIRRARGPASYSNCYMYGDIQGEVEEEAIILNEGNEDEVTIGTD